MKPSLPLDTVRRRLDERARQLEAMIAAAQPRREQDVNEVVDLKDTAGAESADVIADARVEHELAELAEIHQARQRLEAGSYGLCLECGVSIPPQRLAARPAAALCTPCQDSAERQSQNTARRA